VVAQPDIDPAAGTGPLLEFYAEKSIKALILFVFL
jgi:hypothetical protein